MATSYRPIKWEETEPGLRVWVDNYQEGKYPNANPRISGPFTIKHIKNRVLVNGRGVPFMHYPQNLITEE